MGKLIVSNVVSLDGHYLRLDGSPVPIPYDEALDSYGLELLREAGTLLLGRKTFELFRDYWPPVAGNAEAGASQREISRLNNAIDKVVISDALAPDPTRPWGETRIIGRAGAAEAVAELKRQSSKDILVFGSRTMWNGLQAHGLVDEIHLLVGPALLGGEAPLFTGTQPVLLTLIDAHREGTDYLIARYGVRQ